MGALFARIYLDSLALLLQGGAMSDKKTPESEEQSNFVAITCYVLAIVFLLLALFGYGRLHERWPPEIDGSVQKCLIIAFVLFLIPSVKEMNIAGVLSFKAKVEEAKAEVKEMREEVRSLTQMQMVSASVRNEAAATQTTFVNGVQEDRYLRERLDEFLKQLDGVGAIPNSQSLKSFAELKPEAMAERLMITRAKLESALREWKGYSNDESAKTRGRSPALRRMLLEFGDEFPVPDDVRAEHFFALDVMNRAAHGYDLPNDFAITAYRFVLDLSTRLKKYTGIDMGLPSE